jgi:hypothetical protein
MRIVHPAAWLGLCINLFFVAALVFSINHLPVEEFEKLFGEIDRGEFISLMQRMLFLLVSLQALALFLFDIKAFVNVLVRTPSLLFLRRMALALALFAGFFMLPCSAAYMLGVALTYANIELALFEDAYNLAPTAGEAFPSSRIRNMRLAGYGCFAVAAMTAAVGMLEVTLFGIAAGGVLIWLAKRVYRRPPLVVHQDGLALMSTAMSKYIFLPYADMVSATLRDNATICFSMRVGNMDREYVWPLAAIESRFRQQAVELVADTLAENHVELI